MVPYLHQGNIYIKRKLRAWRAQKCISLVGPKSPLTCVGRQSTVRQGRQYRVGNGNLRKLGGPIAMVPCLHQGNIYIKRKLLVWRAQKCVSLVGAKSPLTCAGGQTTPSKRSRYRVGNGNLRKLGYTYRHGTVFAPRQYLHQKEATGMESKKMYFPSRCKKPSYLFGTSNCTVSNESV